MNPKLKSTITTASVFFLLLVALYFSKKSLIFQVIGGVVFISVLIFEIVKKQIEKRKPKHKFGAIKNVTELGSLVKEKYGEKVEL